MVLFHKKMAIALAVAASLPALTVSMPAEAGPSTDALSTCLVRAVTEEDRVVLMRWIFSTMARHPGVSQYAAISDAQRIEINQNGGALFTRLLTADCALETRQAYTDDGQPALSAAFSVLGATAMDGLMTDKAVQASLGDLSGYVDQNRLKAVFGPAPSPAAPQTPPASHTSVVTPVGAGH